MKDQNMSKTFNFERIPDQILYRIWDRRKLIIEIVDWKRNFSKTVICESVSNGSPRDASALKNIMIW